MSSTTDPAFLIIVCVVLFLMFIGFVFGDDKKSKNKNKNKTGNEATRQMIPNNYRTLGEVEEGLRKAGLESSDLILAVDFTKSNTWQGKISYGGFNLHHLTPGELNPYQQVIDVIAEVLIKKLDDDSIIPLYGFGDQITSNKHVFLMNNEQPCHSKEELLAAYADAAANVTLSGPTSFAPIILEAIDVCKSTGRYHILVIIADGLMDDVDATTQAIVTASKYPLSIVMVGVGDGPWDQMETFDDEIPERAFDNFQFVSFTKLLMNFRDPQIRSLQFALEALMELPEQYKIIKSNGLLQLKPDPRVKFQNRLVGKHRFPTTMREGVRGHGGPPPYTH